MSVPHDCNAAKIRCSKYVVIDTTEVQSDRALWDGTRDFSGYYDDLDPEDYDEDYWEGDSNDDEPFDRGYSDGLRLAQPLTNADDDYYEGYAEGVAEVASRAANSSR